MAAPEIQRVIRPRFCLLDSWDLRNSSAVCGLLSAVDVIGAPMVQMMGSGNAAEYMNLAGRKNAAVMVEDSVAEVGRPLLKRSKLSLNHQKHMGFDAFSIPPSEFNPLEEPSPLGLRLRKSPSLLDLIQMRLSQGDASELSDQGKKEQAKESTASFSADKLKASNFPALFLRIGAWEYTSRYEGDLVTKCYYAKHKLVWEVLNGGLKNKIEIQWSDIIDIKANFPDNGLGTLNLVLVRPPLFFKETNPQPRKHTLWQATSDFTGGQASIHRRHFMQCPQGLLGKHFEKLIQCDPRLNFLSQQPEVFIESPYFEPKSAVTEDLDESKNPSFNMNNEKDSAFYGLPDAVDDVHPSLKNEGRDSISMPAGYLSCKIPHRSAISPSVEETGANDCKEPKELSHWNQIKVARLHPSMSVNDLMNHIENCISGERTSCSPILSSNERQNKGILEEITQYLLSDSQHTLMVPDEPSIMSRVNSLCSLLQPKDPNVAENLLLAKSESYLGVHGRKIGDESEFTFASRGSITEPVQTVFSNFQGESNDVAGSKQASSVSRKDSLGDLLLNLPRVPSLQKFWFNISDNLDNQVKE